MTMTDLTRAELVVRPIRFTDQLPRMRDFLSLLGFSPQVSHAESWVTMVGGAGDVALHDAAISGSRSGETGLMFEVADPEALTARFAEAGVGDAEIYDEAWGRVLQVRADNMQLGIDIRPADFYGYKLHEPHPEHDIVSMPLWFGSLAGPFERLLSAAGFVRLDDESWRVWSITGGGLVVVQSTDVGAPAGEVRLAFRTREPLTELADRLTAAGVTLTSDDGGALRVTDPDGQNVLIQQRTD